jgi:membrane-associated phospholipid phosphatase
MIKKYGLALLLVSNALITADSNFTRIRRAQRRVNAKVMRVNAAESRSNQALQTQPTNGDEQLYPDKRASFGKSLPHLSNGLFEVSAFNSMVYALQTGNSNDFLKIPMGTNPSLALLTDPQGSLAFNFIGNDGWMFTMPAPPSLTSAQMAADMVEDYWLALMRDVYFNQYSTNATALAAVADLNNLTAFQGPEVNGQVTTGTLFRGLTPGDLVGPYISQFLYLAVPYGPAPNYSNTVLPTAGITYQAQVVPQLTTNNDFMTTFNDWFQIQNGGAPIGAGITYNTSQRWFIRCGRDLADYVHQDNPSTTYVNAALILFGFGSAALDANNPYLNNPTQKAFVTYAAADVCYMINVATEMALRAAWYFKWQVHRKLRPEVVGFYVNQQQTGAENFGLNQELMNSAALPMIFSTYGSYFLPIAYPEGSPSHPSYPAAHAVIAGACVTILKAFFNEGFIIPNSVEPDPTNTTLVPTYENLTVGNELNKLASNIAIGRNTAGVHYRSDGTQGILLGEQVALAILQDEAYCRNVNFSGYSLTKFDGTTITIGAKRPFPQY